MKEFTNVKVEPTTVTLTSKSNTIYQVFGFALNVKDDDLGDCVELQPSDLRRNPVLVIPRKDVIQIKYVY